MAAGAGFIERQPLYQLYYLLNRSNLFGGQHLVAAQRAVEALLQPEAS
jgi:Fructosamine-3-kinase